MNIIIEPGFKNYIEVFLTGSVLRSLSYLIPALVVYLIVWKFFSKTLENRRITKKEPPASQIWFEIRHSLQTMVIWAGLSILHLYFTYKGWTQIYLEMSDYSIAYYVFSLILVVILHDTYFYWTHRLMHHPKLFKYFHAAHHRSNNPTPWAIFSFQPGEALVQFAVTFFFVFAFPTHYSVLLIWSLWLLCFNIMGHLGYELLPRNFATGRVTQWMSTATHHSQHHKFVRNNFGLYFTFWDRLMKTENPHYVSEVTGGGSIQREFSNRINS